MNSLLRNLVRETIISERAATAQMAGTRNLALAIINHTAEFKTYILFDRNTFVHVLIDEIRKEAQYKSGRQDGTKYTVKDQLKLAKEDRMMLYKLKYALIDRYSEFIVAGSDAHQPGISVSGRSNGAWYMSGPAAIDNYGPLLYDIVMSDVGELMPDRGVVSNSARSVWKYYKDNRKDVVSTPLDNVGNPQTPQTTDDANVHFTDPDDFGNFLDSSYHLAGSGPNVSSLQLAYSQMMKNLESKVGFDRKDIESILVDSTDSFFEDASGESSIVKKLRSRARL